MRRLLLLCWFSEMADDVLSLVCAVMLCVNRRAQVCRCLHLAVEVMHLLKHFSAKARAAAQMDTRRDAAEGASGGSSELSKLLSRACPALQLKAEALAEALTSERHYVRPRGEEEGGVSFDPRFLVFEFAYNILLRKSQVELIEEFQRQVEAGRSLCHQMIMGAGKTTVVAPLLALLLADGKRLVAEVVPPALLHFTRSVLRERFSAVIRKGVYTLHFARQDRVTPELLLKLVQARDSRSVVVSTPTAIKSVMLKTLQLMHALDAATRASAEAGLLAQQMAHVEALAVAGTTQIRRIQTGITRLLRGQRLSSSGSWPYQTLFFAARRGASGPVRVLSLFAALYSAEELGEDGLVDATALGCPRQLTEEQLRSCRRELDLCVRVLEVFRSGVLMVDEVDIILQPLKSELHWPIGPKRPLDFTARSSSAAAPIHSSSAGGGASASSGSSLQAAKKHAPSTAAAVAAAVAGLALGDEASEVGGSQQGLAGTGAVSSGLSSEDSLARQPELPLLWLFEEDEGLRWQLPWFLLDAIFFFYQGRMSVPMTGTAEAWRLLAEIRSRLRQGLREKALQGSPHLLLLSTRWYEENLKAPLTAWLGLYLRLKKFAGLSSEQTQQYLVSRKGSTACRLLLLWRGKEWELREKAESEACEVGLRCCPWTSGHRIPRWVRAAWRGALPFCIENFSRPSIGCRSLT